MDTNKLANEPKEEVMIVEEAYATSWGVQGSYVGGSNGYNFAAFC